MMSCRSHHRSMPARRGDPTGLTLGGIGRRQWLGWWVACGALGTGGRAQAGEAASGHDHSAHLAAMASAASAPPRRSQASYRVPAAPMLDQRGRKVVFNAAIEDGRPVILNFIYTSCSTICPVMSQVFAQVQARLAGELDRIHMVSVSIDPEYDTPERLQAYARQYGAGPQWDFYTGTLDASLQVQRAFDAYRGDKMNHESLVLVRGRRGSEWLRLDGFATAQAIVSAYRTATG